jgi:hypothetical protein
VSVAGEPKSRGAQEKRKGGSWFVRSFNVSVPGEPKSRGAQEQRRWKFFWVIFFLVFFVCLTAICFSFFLWVQHGHAIFVMSFSFAFTGIYVDIWLRFVDSF